MLRSVAVVFFLIWFGLSMSVAAQAAVQDDKPIPKELQQYIKDAQKAGLTMTQIRQNVLKAGWAESTVEDALKPEGAAKDTGAPKVADLDAPKEGTPASSAATPPVNPVTTPPASDSSSAKPATPAATEPGNPAVTPEPGATKPVSVEGARSDDYLIGEGDVLQVSVWGEPTASVPMVTVRTDGKISMPLIKEVKVAGLTPAQVEKNVQEQLGKIIRSPDVTVIVAQINSKKIYLTGSVKREGPLKFTYRMTVLQAISEAGGLTDYAKRKEIYVLHTENGRQYKLPFSYIAVLKGEHMEQNILLSPGDTIVVP
jgi:polysaccharide export outer membrane protein